MDRDAAITRINEACKEIALQMMKVHPAVAHLGDPTTQGDILAATHRLTVELETIKKKLIRLQARDDSTEL